MKNSRLWLFRGLVAAAAGLMLVAWFRPWWNLDIEELGYDMIRLYYWGLEADARLGSFIILLKGTEMPEWFGPLMWAFLAACLAALLIGMYVVGKEAHIGRFDLSRLVSIGSFKVSLSQILIGGVGVAFIVCAIVAGVYASIRMDDMFNTPLQGRTSIELGGELHSYVETHLLWGYYLSYAAGFALVALGLLEQKIIGEPKPKVTMDSQGVGTLGHSRA